jgi:SH3-like domain-containing protein
MKFWTPLQRAVVLAMGLFAVCVAGHGPAWGAGGEAQFTNLQRAKIHLAAGDFRRAVDACRKEVDAHPSVETYLYLTYVYQALDSYVEVLAKADQWVAVELLYINLSGARPDDLVDEPDVLARIAKEVIQLAVRRQADMTAAMAARLDAAAVSRLWEQQSDWRKTKPDGWWFGVPPEWVW